MDYYLLLESKDRKYHPRDRVDDSPSTADGRAIEPDGDPEYCHMFDCAHISEVQAGFITIYSHRQLADKLVTRSGFQVVSARLKEVFDSLRCRDGLAYLPIHVLDEEGSVRSEYWMG
jgi:hypothetical protein